MKSYEKVDEVDEFMNLAYQISCKTYQHNYLKIGFKKTHERIQYIRFLSKFGMLKSFILFDRNTPVSYLYATNLDGRIFAHKTGYDPDYAKLSPGTVL